MADLLVDTDVLVDHLRTGRGVGDPDDRLSFSIISRAELFAGSRAEEDGVRLLLSAMDELVVDGPIAESGGRLRRRHGIALPDALIAATSLKHGLPLLTRNRRHFGRVEGLSLRAPV
ncbi:type II toxin-antitoxin system VapC family toxin [soil metagenome]|jgi:predicted nucleic acid-binding protein